MNNEWIEAPLAKSIHMKTKVGHTTRMTGKGDGTQRFHPADTEITILTGKSVCSTITVDTYCMCASMFSSVKLETAMFSKWFLEDAFLAIKRIWTTFFFLVNLNNYWIVFTEMGLWAISFKFNNYSKIWRTNSTLYNICRLSTRLETSTTLGCHHHETTQELIQFYICTCI